MRVAVLWPRPRRARIEAAARDPGSHPDASDGLLGLAAEGFSIVVEDPYPIPLNPLARSHEIFCGLDPLRSLRVALRRPGYDAVLAIGASSAGWTQRFLGLKRRRPPVLMIDPAMGPWALRKRIQDLIIPRVDRVIVYGRTQLDYLREHYGDQVRGVFVHHRADVRFFDPASAAQTPPAASRYILAIGDDVSRDFGTLLRACAADAPLGRLLEAQDLRCVIHTGRELGTLPARVVHSNGRLSHLDLRDLYRHAAAVVLPLFDLVHAGGINSLVEAMAMSRPIVISRSRGILDYIRDGGTALTVAPGNSEELGAAVARLVFDTELAGRLGSAAREFVTTTCATAVYAKKIAAVIRDAISQNPKNPV